MFFKTKDLMTVGNVGGGLACVLVAMEGMGAVAAAAPAARADVAQTYVFWSGFCIMVALFFDVFDGKVARLLGQMNKFGAEFDNVADLTSYSFAPSFLIYLAYRYAADLPGLGRGSTGQTALAIVLATVPALFGCIRFARFNVRKLDIPQYWLGFPRPASALFLVALVNSHMWPHSGIVQWVGVGLVFLLGFMNLSLVPFISHHDRKWSWYLVIIMNCVWLSVVVSAILGLGLDLLGYMVLPPNLFFDWVLIWLACYLFVAWTDVPLATRQAVKRLTAGWNE